MRVVVSHFFNEAYLLPWWLRHHREIFDHGVLIDRHSTDGSVDICRELVPSWEVVRSETAQFEAIMCDFEVMKHEARFPDAWKIALNTTEFLVAPGLSEVEQFVQSHDLTVVRVPGAIMVDTAPDRAPDPNVPLTEQKYCGVWETEFDFKAAALVSPARPSRSRIYHRYMIGAYAPGRHVSHVPGQCDGNREQAAIWWYAFSPWTDAFKARKLQINATRSDFDKAHRLGFQHEADLPELEHRWATLRPASGPLLSRTSDAPTDRSVQSAAAPSPTEQNTPVDGETSEKPPRGWPRRLLHGVVKRFSSLAGLAATCSSKS